MTSKDMRMKVVTDWFNKGAFSFTTMEVIEQKGVTDQKKLNNLIRKHKRWELWQKENRKKTLKALK